ncbi:amino acid adenylation domain-containing protein [Roseibium salinum]|nr:amino acid adenylation domain-containing protein [Roseibium salinum]
MLVRLSSDDVTVGLALHPIIADPQAMTVLAEDFTKALAGLPLPGEAPRQRAGSSSGGALDHWRRVIGEETECAALPAKGRPEAAVDTGRSGCEMEIPAALAEKVRTIASAHRSSERAVLFCVLNALLARYSGLTEFRTGIVIQGEETGEVTRSEDIMPVAWSIHSGLRFSDLLAQHEEAVGESLKNYVASERIVQAMLTMPGQNDASLARTVFDFRTRAQLQEELPAEIILTPSPAAYGDLSVTVYPRAGGTLRIALDHADGHYGPEMVHRFAGHLVTMIEAVTADPDIRLRDIALVTRRELDWLSAPYPDNAADDDRAVHLIIADHAARTPDKVAIIYGDEIWTHGELEHRANRLAHRLIALGVKHETTVAIQITKSAEAVMAILAVLKAGGAYIPVEPDHPASRNHHILRDADVEVVVTHARWRDRLPDGVAATVIALDEVDLSGEPETAPDVEIHPDQLAYVMYTSGSTGLPKGVAVEHGPLTHHNQATSRVYEMSSDSRELPFLPFSSDGGHERWMVPLMEGGSILLPDAPLWTPEQTLAAMRKHAVNNASIPTTYMQQLAEWADITDGAPPMRLYSFGGEGLPQTTFDLLSRSLKSGILINGYGPTETIMTPMVWKVRPGATFDGAYAPIGRAVGRRRVYVLDADMNPCPIGVTGELYLGGEGVARGYVGKPDVTADRFVPDPFGPHGGRLYRSGDLTRWREDGTVEFVGRVDLQVKLRGYRIELGEIEAALLALEGVGECTVLLFEEDGRKDLVGYAVPEQGGPSLTRQRSGAGLSSGCRAT